MNLDGKIALVTGAGRGIGRGCALALAKRGATLVVNDRPGSPDLEQTTQDLRAFGGTVHGVESDVFTREGCEGLMEAALAVVPQIDVLVSNPARIHRVEFLDFDPVEFERTVSGTFTNGFHMAQLVARHEVEKKIQGSIVFVSSVQAGMPLTGGAAYASSKAALNQLARVMAVELTPHRIRVNVVEPGWTDTPGEHELYGDEAIATEGPQLPWGRLADPEEVGNAAAFLASDSASYITGVVLPVDGGYRFPRLCGRVETQVRAWETIDSVTTADGDLELRRSGDEWLITQDRRVVMSSRFHRSEIVLAEKACEDLAARAAPRILIAGLGMGFTLRAALDVLPANAVVVTAELNPVVARWNEGPLGTLSQNALDDPRVRLEVIDVMRLVAVAAESEGAEQKYDAIVLDLYEGPYPVPKGQVDPLFGKAAVSRARAALRTGGCYAVWSEEPVQSFEDRVRGCGFKVECLRPSHKGPRHVVYLAWPV